MALWPFGKKKDNQRNEVSDNAPVTEAPEVTPTETTEEPTATPVTEPADAAPAAAELQVPAHDAVNGGTGPFDGDVVDIEDFDFSDFSTGTLNLGSMKIALPKDSQVQVEMGEQGPKMLHVVTTAGRITPVAFAAPRSGSQWQEAAKEISAGMRKEGLDVAVETGPWGPEIVGKSPNGVIRVIGVDGPRWMLRMTLAAPADKAEELAELGREVTARTFVYRGDEPVLAGSSLPVALPAQLAQQVQQALAKRGQQQTQAQGQERQAPQPAQADQPGSAPLSAEEEQQLQAAREALHGQGDDTTGRS